MKGVILAAGAGTRLEPLTRELPKPLVSVLGRPLIDYTIEAFARAGFSRLAVVTGHNGHVLRRYLDDGSRYGRDATVDAMPNTDATSESDGAGADSRQLDVSSGRSRDGSVDSAAPDADSAGTDTAERQMCIGEMQ